MFTDRLVPLQDNQLCKGRTITKLMGGGGSEVQKLNEKNSCTPINPKKYSCYGLKKIHTRNLITKKKIPAARKFPPPLITFLMVRP